MKNCPICYSASKSFKFTVTREDKFAITPSRKNTPAVYSTCDNCGLMYLHDDADYETVYSDGSYYGAEREEEFYLKRFNFVNSLSAENSDNVQRIERVNQMLQKTGIDSTTEPKSVLDIGAGLGVFLHRFVHSQWDSWAVEPDPLACKHLRSVLTNTTIIEGTVNEIDCKLSFDLITINRVLEHIFDPLDFLQSVAAKLNPKSVLYIEVPDVISYFEDGANNEAFGYGHYSVYSPEALDLVCSKANLERIESHRCIEPSTKFTLYAFYRLK